MYCSDGCVANTRLGQLPEWVVPFQNGFGWTLLIQYAQKDPRRYAHYFKDLYFWERNAVGYREYNGSGFGYVNTFADLESIKDTYGVARTDIIVFEYNSGLNQIRKISYDEYVETHPKIL